jgi:large subunit ribosomal protein L28
MGPEPRCTLLSSVALSCLLACAVLYISASNTHGQQLGSLMQRPSLSRDVAVNARKNQFASGRKCGLTGKTGQTAYKYCFSHKRATKRQHPNIQKKYVYWPEGQRMVQMKLSTDAIKSIDKMGIEAMAKKAGIDLARLPFRDLRPERKAYLEQHKQEVPMSKKWVSGFYKKTHRMKNPEKLAASKKSPRVGKYYHGTIMFGRFNEEQLRQINDIPLEDPLAESYKEGLEVEDTSAGADTTA